MKQLRSILILCLLFSAQQSFGSWVNRRAEGWAWYEDLEKKEEEKAEPNKITAETSSEQMAKVRKSLEEKLSKAMLDPSEENLRDYIETQKYWVDRSADFAKLWSKVLLNNPNLDETAHHPVSQYGIKVEQELLLEKKYNLIRSLAKDHGLFFFYEGQKKASQAFSLIVKDFMKKHGWEALAVSMDGILLEGFDNNRPDKSVAEKLGMTVFPSLLLVNPKSNQIYPIAFGMISLDQIENNIFLQFEETHLHE